MRCVVRGGGVIRPLVGVLRDSGGLRASLRPLLGSDAGLLVIGLTILQRLFSDPAYWMMANACMDEAVRNAVAVGGVSDALAHELDNFCWCDPVWARRIPTKAATNWPNWCGPARPAAILPGVRPACCISGKDSMKNEILHRRPERISDPPTLLFSESLSSVMQRDLTCQTSDFKREGDALYL